MCEFFAPLEPVYYGLKNMPHTFSHAVEPGRLSFPTTCCKRLNEPGFKVVSQAPNNDPRITHPEARSHTLHTAHPIQRGSHLPLPRLPSRARQ
jgi:hypothetical protein